MNIGTNKLQNIWVSVKVPAGTAAGSYTGTVTVTAKELAEPLTFTYTLNANTKAGNYEITTEAGTLTVTCDEV